uniref:Uncharacterized protein n=1 Tax=Meloidogyne enterolobii TaxID=390850 RepID=A0A6V7V9F9_MELEN|nr:unnamed protein product [Meloidogyne enterolobii]
MIKSLIIISLIIKIHSWTWNDYPSPIGITYWRCGILSPTYVCDPDGMLTDQQRKEIVELVEDFKEKTKRPNSIYTCLREGVRLVVALAKYKIGPEDGSDGTTVWSYTTVFNSYLCGNNRNWTASYDATKCEPVHGIELNTDGFRYCDSTRYLLHLHKDEFEQLDNAWKSYNGNNYYDTLKNYIISLRMLYIHRFSIFDNQDASNEDKIKLTEVQHSLQDTKQTLFQMRQSLDQQNKKSTEFSTAIEDLNKKVAEIRQPLNQGNKTSSDLKTAIGETNKKRSEMRQVQDQMVIGKNITALKEFPSAKQFSNNLWVLFCINTRGVVGSRNSCDIKTEPKTPFFCSFP